MIVAAESLKPLAAPAQEVKPAPGAAAAIPPWIERIDALLRMDKPSVQLTVQGTFQANVEITKSGAGQVELRLRGVDRPLSKAELASLKRELGGRGVKLGGLRY